MEQYKPPGLIKKIYFKNLSFGDAPFKIENAWVEDQGEKHVLLEVSLLHSFTYGFCIFSSQQLYSGRTDLIVCFDISAPDTSQLSCQARNASCLQLGRKISYWNSHWHLLTLLFQHKPPVQVALRWAGDANIAIAIELPAGGEATRMVPKISDLHIQAVGRVMLAPLVGEIPGFGAAVIALRCHAALLELQLNSAASLSMTFSLQHSPVMADHVLHNAYQTLPAQIICKACWLCLCW